MQFDFRSKLQHDKGMVSQTEDVDILHDHRSELSFATTPVSFAPDVDLEVCAETAQEIQTPEADLRLLAADGFGAVV